MKLEFLRTWWPVVVAVLNVLFFLIAWGLSRTFARKDELDTLSREQLLIKERITNLASHSDVASLKVCIERLRGDIKEINPKLEGLGRISNLLLENELKDKK